MIIKANKNRRARKASYTVEAAYVMTIVFLAISSMIRTAYTRCREETAVLRLHHVVELLRGQEEETERTFYVSALRGTVRRDGQQAEGSVRGDGMRKVIQADVHEPENMMRMLTLFDGIAAANERTPGHGTAEEGESDG